MAKTTTVRILTTLLKPDGGTVRIAGYDALREPDKVRSRIGVAGQSGTMDGYLTGLQNMMMIRRLYRFGKKDAKRRGQELIEQFGPGYAPAGPDLVRRDAPPAGRGIGARQVSEQHRWLPVPAGRLAAGRCSTG